MPKMTFTSPRATLEETLAFANAVREAGGGNPLDALMPAVPSDPKQCLIAKNLNFNCAVGGGPDLDAEGQNFHPPYDECWYMRCESVEIRDRIATALDLTAVDGQVEVEDVDDGLKDRSVFQIVYKDAYYIELPREISQIAADFDRWSDALVRGHIDEASADEIERLKTFAPYIEASLKECWCNGIFNEKGELIL